MKILANRKIKALFYKIMVCMLIFIVVSVSFMMFELNNAALLYSVMRLFMCIAIMAYPVADTLKNRMKLWKMQWLRSQNTFPVTGDEDRM